MVFNYVVRHFNCCNDSPCRFLGESQPLDGLDDHPNFLRYGSSSDRRRYLAQMLQLAGNSIWWLSVQLFYNSSINIATFSSMCLSFSFFAMASKFFTQWHFNNALIGSSNNGRQLDSYLLFIYFAAPSRRPTSLPSTLDFLWVVASLFLIDYFLEKDGFSDVSEADCIEKNQHHEWRRRPPLISSYWRISFPRAVILPQLLQPAITW